MKDKKNTAPVFRYFNRDMSWLSFNYRVLLEAADEQLPLYERINFIAIYTSNLEEFYKVRVAEHRAAKIGVFLDGHITVKARGELEQSRDLSANGNRALGRHHYAGDSLEQR